MDRGDPVMPYVRWLEIAQRLSCFDRSSRAANNLFDRTADDETELLAKIENAYADVCRPLLATALNLTVDDDLVKSKSKEQSNRQKLPRKGEGSIADVLADNRYIMSYAFPFRRRGKNTQANNVDYLVSKVRSALPAEERAKIVFDRGYASYESQLSLVRNGMSTMAVLDEKGVKSPVLSESKVVERQQSARRKLRQNDQPEPAGIQLLPVAYVRFRSLAASVCCCRGRFRCMSQFFLWLH